MIVFGVFVRCDGCGDWCTRAVYGPRTSVALAVERAAKAGWTRTPYLGLTPSGRKKSRWRDLCRWCSEEQG